MSKLTDHPIWEVRSIIRKNLLKGTLGSRRWLNVFQYDAQVREIIKQFGDHKGRRICKNLAVYLEIKDRISKLLAAQVVPTIHEAYTNRWSKGWNNLPFGNAQEAMRSHDALLYFTHFVHVSEEDPKQVAFTPDERYLLTDRQIRMRPGRYLTKFWGSGSERPLFDDDEVKRIAEVFIATSNSSGLLFVPNTDPDGWEWVYENSPVSCMRYNGLGRYLDYDLYGQNHPVRSYANPENDLALAYIMLPGEKPPTDWDSFCDVDKYVVAARTIVNTRDKTWLKIYCGGDTPSQTRMEEGLSRAGYRESDSTLHNQRLLYREYDGKTLCPYLDGSYTRIKNTGDCLLVVSYGVDGQNSSGILEGVSCQCCDSMVDSEDDLTYVGDGVGAVCSYCLEDYTYAYVSRNQMEWVSNSESLYWYNGDGYTEGGLSGNHLSVCDHCGEINHDSDMTWVGDNFVCDSHTVECEVSGDVVMEEDSTNSEFDGVISDVYRVLLYPSNGYGHIDRCYRLSEGSRNVYVHQNTIIDSTVPDLEDLFMVVGTYLLRSDGGVAGGRPPRYGDTYTNVEAGYDCEELEAELDKILEQELEAA